jgi:hypothetical protein
MLILILCAFARGGSNASSPGPPESRSVYIAEGLGVEGITVGYSTKKSVTSKYGDVFYLIDHNKYSYEIRYPETGMSFWYRYYDKEEKIFCIAVRPPSHGFTSRGIVVGQSTLQDVFKVYGKAEFSTTSAEETWFAEYPGVDFHIEYKASDKRSWTPQKLLKRKIIEIDVIAVESDSKQD